MNSKSFHLQFLALLLSIFLFSSTIIDCRAPTSNAAVRRKSSESSIASLKLLWGSVQKLITNALGSQAEKVFEEFGSQFSALEHAADDLESLQDQDVINSINEVIDSFFTGLEDAVEAKKDSLNKGSFISDVAFHTLMQSYESKIMKVVRSSKNLPRTIKTQLETVLPAIFNNLSSVYSQITQASKMGLPAFLITSYLPMLMAMKDQVFVTTKTFEHVANLRKETFKAFDELVGDYLTPDKIQMLSMVIGMLAQNMQKPHDEL